MHVVLVEPEYGGNLGLIARVAKNFGADGLVLVNPKAEPTDRQAVIRAVHAKDYLNEAVVVEGLKEVRERFSYLAGLTARTASEYNVNWSCLSLRELERVEGMALVFGRESSGLTNGELSMCDAAVNIPTSPEYPTLNISHAVAVALYQLSGEKEREVADPAVRRQLEVFWGQLLDELDYGDKKRTQMTLFRRVLGKSQLGNREAHGLAGVLSRLLKRLKS